MTSETQETEARNDRGGAYGGKTKPAGWKADIVSRSRAAFGKSGLRLSDVVKQAGETAALSPDRSMPLEPQLAERLAAAETEQADLQSKLGEVVLAAQLGEAGASDKLAELTGRLRNAAEAITQLRAAHEQAIKLDAEAEAADVRVRQQEQLVVLESHAAARLEAVVRLAASLEAAHHDFRRFREITDLMLASVPEGASLPPGLILEYPATLIAGEMFRHSEPGGICLPGAGPADFSLRDNPSGIEPAADVVGRSNKWISRSIRTQLGVAVEEDQAA